MMFDLPRHAVLLDDARPGGHARLFAEPMEWIEARDPEATFAALARIDAAVRDGLWVAGAFAYELGLLLEPRLRPLYRGCPDPLIAVGLYAGPRIVDGAALARALAAPRRCRLSPLAPGFDRDAYRAAFVRVRDYIAAGDTYQINLTFPLAWAVDGDPLHHAAAWRTRSGAGHIAIVTADDRTVLSFSPELFVASDGDGLLRTRPMKGTTPRGRDAASDEAARLALRADVKQRAENLMIVDLLRNDLARICRAGSVAVSDLFTVETYPTLHTLTSGISGALKEDQAPSDILRALFPCGSVTGAPKIRAMEIIAEVEPGPRGVYCGAVGCFGPGGTVDLNVAIRTLIHEHGPNRLRLHVGGGIVYDSRADAEYDEALLKARFATAAEEFDLLETMRWQPGNGYLYLAEHLARLARAAEAFSVAWDRAAAEAALSAHASGLDGSDHRVRLRLRADGTAIVESTPLAQPYAEDGRDSAVRLRLAVARTRLSADDPFVRHKTTQRALYDAALAEAKAAGADEALLLNAHGRVADGSFTTIFLARGGTLFTPPPSEGALDGVLKRVLQSRPRAMLIEAPLTLEDLATADAIFAGNSVRGLLRAELL